MGKCMTEKGDQGDVRTDIIINSITVLFTAQIHNLSAMITLVIWINAVWWSLLWPMLCQSKYDEDSRWTVDVAIFRLQKKIKIWHDDKWW